MPWKSTGQCPNRESRPVSSRSMRRQPAIMSPPTETPIMESDHGPPANAPAPGCQRWKRQHQWANGRRRGNGNRPTMPMPPQWKPPPQIPSSHHAVAATTRHNRQHPMYRPRANTRLVTPGQPAATTPTTRSLFFVNSTLRRESLPARHSA